MVKTVDVEIEGMTFKLQENMSFEQKAEFRAKIEEFIDLEKYGSVSEEERAKTNPFSFVKKGINVTQVTTDMFKYMILKYVIEPKITEAMLKDPDYPHSDICMALGLELFNLAMQAVAKSILLKKTPTK